MKELMDDEQLLIVPADKGNATVVMDKEDYIHKLSTLLQEDTYHEIKTDPTAKIQKQIKGLLYQSSVPMEERRRLLEPAPKPPRLYGLPKVHKEGFPLRPIVSAIDSPTHNLARYLAKQLQPFSGRTPTYVRNSAHFIELIEELRVSDTDMLVSFDVESLFTNIPIDEAVEITKSLVAEGLAEDIPKMVEFCLTNSYFVWNGTFYGQRKGAAIGSPLSPIIANLFMEKLEEKALRTYEKPPKMFLRYVDDTSVVWPHGKSELNNFLRHLNIQNSSIKFTMEIDENGRLPFLDVLVSKKQNGRLGHSVYRKPTHTDQYLNANSHHHPQQKRATFSTLYQRAFSICDGDSIENEKRLIINAFKKNDFSVNTIVNMVAKEEKKHKQLAQKTNAEKTERDIEEKKIFNYAYYLLAGSTWIWEALSKLKSDESPIILRADKGNATVLMTRKDYNEKISQLLDDPAYQQLKSNPTTRIERQVKELIKRSSIPQETQRNLIPSAEKPPRLYGLPKIHKEGVPLRPIVSQIGAPTYLLSNGVW
ncbi:uncharacterized protein LOC124159689 [Ischnura elegans]|uniref:uncharacterized protein LOC124159689 n=1 Tax=Ischnura elegans TaxID=197161 RepID=UPI001ED89B97|nr:uncharacterized protein LOC124159689 [Ischnura elegans]